MTISSLSKFPAGLGYEAAGTIDAVGKDVGGLAIGDEVDVIPSFSMNQELENLWPSGLCKFDCA
jgi:NADPH:quinone reductase-like Zn-dependent oxidoreductase